MTHFVSVNGRDLMLGDKPMRFRGINIGNYLLIEHFMIGLFSTEEQMRKNFKAILGTEIADAFFTSYLNAFFTEQDARFLTALGVNMIRLPFHHRHFIDDLAPGVIKERGFKLLDHVIDICKKYGIYVLLDFHAVPGCQARDWNSESTYGEAFFWERKVYQDQLIMLWSAIAEHYQHETTVFGYDLIGEPVCHDSELFDIVNARLLHEIRKVDTNHIMVLENNFWGKEISSLNDALFADPLVLPSFHHYPTQFSPFAKLAQYPGHFEGHYYDKQALRETLKNTYDIDRITRPHIAGEFGMHYHRNTDALLAMTDDCAEFFEEKRFPWMLWSYKDIGSMGLVHPASTTPWMRFVQSEAVQSIHQIFAKGQEAFFQIITPLLPVQLDIPEPLDQVYALEMRRAWHRLLLPHVVSQLKQYDIQSIRMMAESFAFAHCIPREGMCKVMTKYTGASLPTALSLFDDAHRES